MVIFLNFREKDFLANKNLDKPNFGKIFGGPKKILVKNIWVGFFFARKVSQKIKWVRNYFGKRKLRLEICWGKKKLASEIFFV